MPTETVPESIRRLERPDPALWKHYVIHALLTGPGIIGALPYLYFRYHTLRYRFDEEGIHMKVGILFRREVNLTYARIQDIHLRSGIIQRWLGLADVQVQTASGSTGPELVIEGFKEFEVIRDFLYTRMRGYQTRDSARQTGSAATNPSLTGQAAGTNSAAKEALVPLLLEIRDELRQTRELLQERAAERGQPPEQS